jgi:hypothetical protein
MITPANKLQPHGDIPGHFFLAESLEIPLLAGHYGQLWAPNNIHKSTDIL